MHKALLGYVWRPSTVGSNAKRGSSSRPSGGSTCPHWRTTALVVPAQTPPRRDRRNVGKRTALVLGNQDYKFAPLGNPLNEAGDLVSLRELGFDVLMVKDLSGMRETLQKANHDLSAMESFFTTQAMRSISGHQLI